MTWKNHKIARRDLGVIKRMGKQCVPGTPPFFVRTGDEASVNKALIQVSSASSKQKWKNGPRKVSNKGI